MTYKEALENIVKPKYGLQGIYEDHSEETLEFYKELYEYYSSLAKQYERLAREALQEGNQE